MALEIIELKHTDRRTHVLNIMEPLADAIFNGSKTFDIRKNERGFNKGDFVRYQCTDWNHEPIEHEINHAIFEITYVHSGYGMQERFVAFSIEDISMWDGGGE